MDRNERAAKLIPVWVSKVGNRQAIARLILRGMSASSAEKICSDRYPSPIKGLVLETIIEEMAKDGFTLPDEAS